MEPHADLYDTIYSTPNWLRSRYQKLELKHIPDRGCTPAIEFRWTGHLTSNLDTICACAYEKIIGAILVQWSSPGLEDCSSLRLKKNLKHHTSTCLYPILYPYTLLYHSLRYLYFPLLYELRTQRISHSWILIISRVFTHLLPHFLSLSVLPHTSKVMEIITLFLSFCICLWCPGSIFNQVMMVALGFSNYDFLLPYSILLHSVTEYAFSNSLLVLCLYHDYFSLMRYRWCWMDIVSVCQAVFRTEPLIKTSATRSVGWYNVILQRLIP